MDARQLSEMHFYKYQGAGNDFIILDNRVQHFVPDPSFIRFLCDRRFGIGADGLMLLQEKAGYDFEMIYFNADGNPGSMCGNGGRCLVQFARNQGIQREEYHFLASDGEHFARAGGDNQISLKMNDVSEVTMQNDAFVLNTGSPHFVQLISNLDAFSVYDEGKKIRHSEPFQEEGINVNFVERKVDGKLFVRTFERGVEDETLSCGTGVTAAALVAAESNLGFNRVEIVTNGGTMKVEYQKINDMKYTDIWLTGPAVFVFEGKIKGEVPNV